jgi:hypothetical protein
VLSLVDTGSFLKAPGNCSSYYWKVRRPTLKSGLLAQGDHGLTFLLPCFFCKIIKPYYTLPDEFLRYKEILAIWLTLFFMLKDRSGQDHFRYNLNKESTKVPSQLKPHT